MNYKKAKNILWISITILLGITLIILLLYYIKNVSFYNNNIDSVVLGNQEGYTNDVVNLEQNHMSENAETSILYNTIDILNYYKERIGEDFAILITNQEILLQYKEYKKLRTDYEQENEDKMYQVYFLRDEDNNIIQRFSHKEEEEFDAVFINFNRVLLDNVIHQDMNGNFISERGFSTSIMKEMNLTLDSYITAEGVENYTKGVLYDAKQQPIGVVYIESTLSKEGN